MQDRHVTRNGSRPVVAAGCVNMVFKNNERYVVPSTCSSSFRMGVDRLASVLERLEDRTPNVTAQSVELVAMECSTYDRRLREGVGR